VIHTNERIIRHKLGLLNLAQELGNVAQACRVMGVSRDTFYRYKAAKDEGGINALLDKSRRTPNPKNRVDEATEEAVVAYALEQPAHGQVRVSNELRKRGVFVSASGVRSDLAAPRPCFVQAAAQGAGAQGRRRGTGAH
jgi:hypothetical protein